MIGCGIVATLFSDAHIPAKAEGAHLFLYQQLKHWQRYCTFSDCNSVGGSNSHVTHSDTETNSAQHNSHVAHLDPLHQLDGFAFSVASHVVCTVAGWLLAHSLIAFLLHENCSRQGQAAVLCRALPLVC